MAKFTKETAAQLGAKGGARNKGRQSPATKEKEEARAILRRRIEEDIEPLYNAWRDSAVGHHVQITLPSGEVKVYKRSPNAVAIKDMFERAFGKPTQPIEGTIKVDDLSAHAQAILHELNIELTDEEDGEEVADGHVSQVVKAPRPNKRK